MRLSSAPIFNTHLFAIAILFTAIASAEEAGNTAHAEAWWSFQPLANPVVPALDGDNWSANPIDSFIYEKLRDKGIEPAPRATQLNLVRRLYFDLVGMPPTPEEIDAYLNDVSPDPWGKLVDTLLADPRYGEHWARFWLDLVRYAESDGWNKDSYRPHIWRYRDYVVNSFNEDKPYPQFVREQLAGDEMPGNDPNHLIATGFLRLGIYEYNQRDARGQWNDIMNEMTDVSGDVFYGLSMSCSRCHDHKFDPIPQTDYFGLRAFFEPVIWTNEKPGQDDAERQRQQEQWEAATATIRSEIDALCQPYIDKKWHATIDKFPYDIQDCFNKPVEERTSWEHQMAYLVERQFYEEGVSWQKSMSKEDTAKLEALNKKLAEFDDIKPKPLPTVMSVQDFTGTLSPTTIPEDSKQSPVAPQFLTTVNLPSPKVSPLERSSGRRTALAQWIGNKENPLTTRLIVNRIWQQHFGRGIVQSPSDFGRLGQPPTHPELLDWLTRAYIDNGWSIKRLHKLILMSSTWRQSTHHPQADSNLQKDPAEALIWRARTRRLRAEEMRDAMLAASGLLDKTLGGPSVETKVPRRGLYVMSKRNSPDPLLHTFDAANGLASVAKRNETTTPTQALIMVNSEYTLQLATKFGGRLRKLEPKGVEVALSYGFRTAWGREPTPEELARAVAYVFPDHAEDKSKMDSHSLIDFCHILFNANEFLYVD